MSKVAITKSLLDDLADVVSAKTGEQTPLTIEEMTDIIDDILNGNEIEYGLTDGTSSLAGVGKVDSMKLG